MAAGPGGIRYGPVTLNEQRAILAPTPEGQPFFALFLYLSKDGVKMMHVIAGRKLGALQV